MQSAEESSARKTFHAAHSPTQTLYALQDSADNNDTRFYGSVLSFDREIRFALPSEQKSLPVGHVPSF